MQVRIEIDKELHRSLKVTAAKDGITLHDLIVLLLKNGVKNDCI